MSCLGTIQNTPPTLEIKSFIKCAAGKCTVRSLGGDRPRRWQRRVKSTVLDSHEVEIINYGGRSYEVDIHGECRSQYVQYYNRPRERRGPVPQPIWYQSVPVPARPGRRERFRKRKQGGKIVQSQNLMSLGPAQSETILTKIGWVVPQWPCTRGTDFLNFQVDTL